MSEEHCPYCYTPYGDDRDDAGLPFCDCETARLGRAEALIEYYKAQDERNLQLIRMYQKTQIATLWEIADVKKIVDRIFYKLINTDDALDTSEVELQRVKKEN